MLARPWQTIEAGAPPADSARAVTQLLERGRISGDDEVADLGAIVVGLPRRLNGTDNEQTQPARDFASALADLANVPVRLQDERLSSHEAESRLSVTEKDWRRRKAQLDAAAAAVILQDYLDESSASQGQVPR